MKGKSKKKGPYANSINEGKVKQLTIDLQELTDEEFKKKYSKTKAEIKADMKKVNEDDLAEQDLIVIPGQGRLRRTGFVKQDLDQGEHEGHTLKNSLHTIARAASDLDKRLSVQSEFPEWVSEKIGAAKGMMVTVMDYLISSQEMQHDTDSMNEGMSNTDYTPQVGEEILWRSRNPMNKMMPVPGTVLAIAPGKVTIKIKSPRLIQNIGKDTIVLNLSDYVLMPKQGVSEASDTMQRYGQLIIKRAKAARDAEPEPKKEEPPAPSDISSISTRDLMQQLRKPKKQGVAEGDNNSTHGMDSYVKPVRPGKFTPEFNRALQVKPVRPGKFNPEFHKALQKGIEQRNAARERMQANLANLPTYTKDGVAEGAETEADIDKKIAFHQQGQAAAQYKGSMNKMHAAKIRDLEAKKAALKQGVAEGQGSIVDKCASLAAKYFNSAGLQRQYDIGEYIKINTGNNVVVDKCASLAAKYFNSAGLQRQYDIGKYIKANVRQGVAEGLKEKEYIVIASMGENDYELEFRAKTPDGALMQAKKWQKQNHIREVHFTVKEQGVAEGKIDFAKKLQKNVDKHNKAVVKTKQDIGSRVADIGAGGKEYNVKTDAAWDAAKKKVSEGSKQ
jgi:hypothetical protein